jgi:hypothetical protein
VKDGLYRDQFLVDMFLPRAIEVFVCLHQHMDEIFHRCANMAGGVKGIASFLSFACTLQAKGVNGVIVIG